MASLLVPISTDELKEVPIPDIDKRQEFMSRYKIDPENELVMEDASQQARRRFLSKLRKRVKKSSLPETNNPSNEDIESDLVSDSQGQTLQSGSKLGSIA